MPALETEPVGRSGDAADDPVILAAGGGGPVWIVGTDKQFGLRIYDFEGTQLHALATGRLNNVDAVPMPGGSFLVAASNRTTPAIDLYGVDPGRNAAALVKRLPLDLDEPYGLCMSRDGGETAVFVGDKTGRVQQWTIADDLDGVLVRTIRFESQTEGCVVDTAANTLYVGEEATGLWAVDLGSGAQRLVDRTGAGFLTADVEGMDIYRDDDARYLVVSSQGDDAFVVYSLPDVRPLVKFRVGANGPLGIDATSDTDGLAVSPGPLPGYPRGILVVQDGWNVALIRNQNFKVVDWRQVATLLENSG